MDPETPLHDEITRRGMLKRLGAGAAVAWTAPVLTSLGQPAFAQTPVCDPSSCEAFPCGDFENPCGENPETGPCICAATADARCECLQPICLEDDDCEFNDFACPEGYACVNPDCCGYSFCAALCDTPLSPRARARGRRWG
jgi:hypothetical protein